MQNQTELDRALPLLDTAEDVADDAEAFVAGIRELQQRVNAGKITAEERAELGGDLVAIAETLMGYALAVLA